jgi:hypothetical protein
MTRWYSLERLPADVFEVWSRAAELAPLAVANPRTAPFTDVEGSAAQFALPLADHLERHARRSLPLRRRPDVRLA